MLAVWLLAEAVRLGASRATVARIASNIGIDALVGAVPVAGDLFDFAWKSNLRNVVLLERHQADPARTRRADRLFVVVVAVTLLAVCVALMVGSALLAGWLFHLLFGR